MKQYPDNFTLMQHIRRNTFDRQGRLGAFHGSSLSMWLGGQRVHFAIGFLSPADPQFIELGNEQTFLDVEEYTASADKHRILDSIRDQRDALHYLVEHTGTFYRVIARIAQQHMGFIKNKVLLMLRDVLFECRRAEFLHI